MLVVVRYTSMLNLMKVSFFICAFSMTKNIQKDKKLSKTILRIISIIYDKNFFVLTYYSMAWENLGH